jgi:hypothetical protein
MLLLRAHGLYDSENNDEKCRYGDSTSIHCKSP